MEVDGLLNLDEFAEQTGIALPEGPYETAAGYVLAALGDLPSVGASVQVAGHTITVTELDGRRVARLRVTPDPHPGPRAARRPGDPARLRNPSRPASPSAPASPAAQAPRQPKAPRPSRPVPRFPQVRCD